MRSRLWFFALLFFPVAASAQVAFSEIMYDAPEPGGDTGREWIEVQNIGTAAIDISNWKLVEGDTNHKLVIAEGNTMLPSQGFAVIADKPDKFLVEHPGFSGTLFDSTFSLNNTTGERLVLKNASSTLISEVSYLPSWGAQGDGNSLQSFSGEWSASVPTPGTANVRVVVAPKPVVISKPALQENPVKKFVVSENLPPKEEKNENSPVSAAAAVSAPVASESKGSGVMWWFLLGGVIVVAFLAYWIGGREKEDEYIIVEDTNNA